MEELPASTSSDELLTATLAHSITDKQLSSLYREVLVPWEQKFSSNARQWSISALKDDVALAGLEIVSVELASVGQALGKLLNIGAKDFFVLVRSTSQARDLFRHVRNAIAHAGVTRHTPPFTSEPFIRFKASARNRKDVAMVGQLQEANLPALLRGLTAAAIESASAA